MRGEWLLCVFFFFKQKTAYEIKECDWSSDVCSSDLEIAVFSLICFPFLFFELPKPTSLHSEAFNNISNEIGRASCRERV